MSAAYINEDDGGGIGDSSETRLRDRKKTISESMETPLDFWSSQRLLRGGRNDSRHLGGKGGGGPSGVEKSGTGGEEGAEPIESTGGGNRSDWPTRRVGLLFASGGSSERWRYQSF